MFVRPTGRLQLLKTCRTATISREKYGCRRQGSGEKGRQSEMLSAAARKADEWARVRTVQRMTKKRQAFGSHLAGGRCEDSHASAAVNGGRAQEKQV